MGHPLGAWLSAYLDPGAGSMLVQALLGGAAAVAVVFKLCWRRLLALLAGGRKSDDTPLTDPS